MSSAFNSGEAAAKSVTQASTDASGGAEPGALDQVLEQTLKSLAAGWTSDPGDLVEFAEVARAHAGEPFGQEPVAVELVLAALGAAGSASGLPPATLTAAARSVAATLCDDPPSRERLERLWRRLSGCSS